MLTQCISMTQSLIKIKKNSECVNFYNITLCTTLPRYYDDVNQKD